MLQDYWATCNCMMSSYQCMLIIMLNAVICIHPYVTSRVIQNATTFAGFRVLMNCSILSQHEPDNVVWLNPAGIAVSNGYTVIANDSYMRVIGNPLIGEYHMLIRYARYPQDVGLWSCINIAQSVQPQQSQLTILVPPAKQNPSVTPVIVPLSSTDTDSTVYTLNCVGHYAFPPVELNWIKEYGPDVTYTVLPPRVIMSRVNTVSINVALVVTPANAKSLFTCLASHPSFRGKIGRSSVHFMMSDGNMTAYAQAQTSIVQQKPNSILLKSAKQLDTIDKSFILLTVAIITGCLTVGVLLSKCTKWQLNVNIHRLSNGCNNNHRMNSIEETGNMLSVTSSTSDQQHKRYYCWRKCKIVMFMSFTVFLLTSLLFSFPFYMKTISMPLVDTDEMLSVFAGSALWLDCSSLVQPLNSLIQVSWYRRNELLYYQYWLTDRVVGYPPNSTTAFMFAARVTSQNAGQVIVYPVAPNEDGIYRCDVIMAGSKSKRSKTFTVFVLMGPIVNYALLVCIGVALVSSIGMISVIVYHSVKCHCHQSHSTCETVNTSSSL